MLVQLASAELISQHPLLDPVQEVGRRRRHERQVAAAAVNPLSFRVPLFDPTHLLQACLPFARRLFTPGAALLWAMPPCTPLLWKCCHARCWLPP